MTELIEVQPLTRFPAELNAFYLSPTIAVGTSTVLTPATSTSSPSKASSLTTAFPTSSNESPPAVNHIPSAAIAGGIVGVVLSLSLLILAAWLRFRRIRSRRLKAELPMQSPSLASLVGLGDKYLTPVSSIPSSVTQVATDLAQLPFNPFTEQRWSLSSPASPAARSSVVMPVESRPESRISTASTIVCTYAGGSSTSDRKGPTGMR